MPAPVPPVPNPTNDRATMRRRFGYYFVGLAIGLVLLGLLESAKFWAKQQQQEQAASPAPGASK